MSLNEARRDPVGAAGQLCASLPVRLLKGVDVSKLKVMDVVRTVELSPVELPGAEHLYFRLEVLRDGEGFVGRVWRTEFFRLQPTFPQHAGAPADEPSDEQVLVRDDAAIDEATGNSVEAVLDEMVRRIEVRFFSA